MIDPVRIVAIEDSPADVRLLRMALDETDQPFTLQVFLDGASALRFIGAADANTAPDLFVLDLHLPGHDGATILRAIRNSPALAHARVAVLTTCGSPEEEAEVMRIGVDWYATKARDWDGTMELVRKLLALAHN